MFPLFLRGSITFFLQAKLTFLQANDLFVHANYLFLQAKTNAQNSAKSFTTTSGLYG